MITLPVAIVALGLAACSGSAAHTSEPATGVATITIANFAFSPGSITVHAGATVTVHNKDSATHTVTSLSGAFKTGDVPGGTTARFTAPTRPGTYPYRCNIHQFMTGTLVVS
ncbi:MAG: cupredoxin domain-containing protein [Acidimicrobiales bacterium]